MSPLIEWMAASGGVILSLPFVGCEIRQKTQVAYANLAGHWGLLRIFDAQCLRRLCGRLRPNGGRGQSGSRAGLERLVRYCARGALALERLHVPAGIGTLSSPTARPPGPPRAAAPRPSRSLPRGSRSQRAPQVHGGHGRTARARPPPAGLESPLSPDHAHPPLDPPTPSRQTGLSTTLAAAPPSRSSRILWTQLLERILLHLDLPDRAAACPPHGVLPRRNSTSSRPRHSTSRLLSPSRSTSSTRLRPMTGMPEARAGLYPSFWRPLAPALRAVLHRPSHRSWGSGSHGDIPASPLRCPTAPPAHRSPHPHPISR